MGAPFHRASMMMAAIAALASNGLSGLAFQAQLAKLGPYESRGKNKTKRHDRGGVRVAQRAAAKARSVRSHHARSRGRHA